MSPNLREHIRHDSEFFKVTKGAFRWVHLYMDAPREWKNAQGVELGKYHRKFFHDKETCALLGMRDRSGLWTIYNGIYMPMAQAICLEHIRKDIGVTKKRNAIAREKYKKEKGLNTKNKKKKT